MVDNDNSSHYTAIKHSWETKAETESEQDTAYALCLQQCESTSACMPNIYGRSVGAGPQNHLSFCKAELLACSFAETTPLDGSPS